MSGVEPDPSEESWMSEGKGMPDPKGQTGLRGVLPAGTALRGYELKSILGQGAFGITYRARDLTLGRDVAIKEYLPTSLALREGRTTVMPRSPDHAEQFAWGRERFLDEARTLARLDRTPAIVRVHDFLEANGTAYMVMALIEGETLAKKLLREQRLAPEVIERLVFPLLDGLEEVHAIGFLHRDIKPANIMLDSHGRPTLIDFGASRAAMAERTTTMTAIFTPGYAAAEQFTSTDLGPWTDIYGLAATLYHAITGKIPPSAVERILNDAYQPLAELQPEGYDPALLVGIDAGLAIRADDRPQSIAQWRHILRSGEALPSQEATHVATRLHRAARKASGKRQVRLTLRGPALAGAIAAAVVVLAGGGWLAWQGSTPVGTVVQGLSAEQLEQALAERRRADALAAEKRRLEEEARQKAVADAEAQREAQAELEQAREARQKAEQELAELKARIAAGPAQPTAQQDPAAVAAQRAAEEEAQRKAEAEAAAMRQAEEEAQKRVEAEAEAFRQAGAAVARLEAERQEAEQQARAKAEAEQAALKRASEETQRKAAEAKSVRQAEVARAVAEAEQKKAEAERQAAEAEAKAKADAETAEKALRLDQPGRERLQVALTLLGFDTRGTDGILGARSREMIAAWQKVRRHPVTGFLTASQHAALLKEAAPALSKYDEQKKAEAEKKVDEPKVAAAPTPVMAVPRATTNSANKTTSPDGLWRGSYACTPIGPGGVPYSLDLKLKIANGRSSGGGVLPAKANDSTMSIEVAVDPPNVTVTRTYIGVWRVPAKGSIQGQFDGTTIRASGKQSTFYSSFDCTLALTRVP